MTKPYALHFEESTPEAVRRVMSGSRRGWLAAGALILPDEEDEEFVERDEKPPVEKVFSEDALPFERTTHLYDLLRFEIFRFLERGEFVILPVDDGLLVLGTSWE